MAAKGCDLRLDFRLLLCNRRMKILETLHKASSKIVCLSAKKYLAVKGYRLWSVETFLPFSILRLQLRWAMWSRSSFFVSNVCNYTSSAEKNSFLCGFWSVFELFLTYITSYTETEVCIIRNQVIKSPLLAPPPHLAESSTQWCQSVFESSPFDVLFIYQKTSRKQQ